MKNLYKLFSFAKQNLLFLACIASWAAANAQATYSLSYTGTIQTLTLQPGTFDVRMWGANGGNSNNSRAGIGGYSNGTLTLLATTTVYIGVGQSPPYPGAGLQPGGWNGGGSGYAAGTGRAGGGATHIANANGVLSSLVSNSTAVYMVAGGGGGDQNAGVIGHGGGLSGGGSYPGTQTGSGGSTAALFGSFGQGGNITTSYGGGGGGGWFGGGGNQNNAGSGGSGYIGGVTNGITTMSGSAGYSNNPDPAGHGYVIITELCNFSLYAVGPTNSISPVICAGQSATLMTNAVSNYSWSTGATTSSLVVTPATNTVYNLTATSPSNCTASRSISITVSGGLPVLSISNPSNNICFGKAITLTASGALSYTWTNPGVVNGQTFMPSSTAQYTVTGTNGCGTGSAVTGVTVAPLQVTASSNTNLVCQGYTAALTASSSVNGYTWMPGPIVAQNPIVSPLSSTIYTVTASDGTCAGTQTVLVSTKTTPIINIPQTSITMCLGEVITVTASGAGTGGTYSWTPGNATTASFTTSPPASTLYIVYGTNSLNCTSSAQVPVIVVQPLPLNVGASSTLVCTGASVNLSANGSNSYSWTNGPGTPNYLVNPTAAMTVYTVTGYNTSNTCTATQTIAIAALIPNVSVTSPVSMCSGGSATVTATGANTYTWNGTNMGSTNVFIAAPAQTTTFVLLANTNSLSTTCGSTHSAVVNVNPNPTVTVVLTKTNTICKGNTNTLTASGASTYTWAANGSTATAITVSPNVTTNYSVTGTDANGCVNGIETQQKVSNCSGIQEERNFAYISVYPNPNNGQFFVKSESAVTINLSNLLGQHIQTIDLSNENGFSADVRGLAKGIYYLSVVDGSEQSVFTKLVVE